MSKKPDQIDPLEKEDKEAKKDSKAETRMFQTGIGKHEHLTKAEAQKRGHFWKD